MSNSYVVNPETGRRIKVGGATYNKLRDAGVAMSSYKSPAKKTKRGSKTKNSKATVEDIRKKCASKTSKTSCAKDPDCRWGKLFGEEKCMKSRTAGKERVAKEKRQSAARKRAKGNTWLAFVKAYWEASNGLSYKEAIQMAAGPYHELKTQGSMSVSEAAKLGADYGRGVKSPKSRAKSRSPRSTRASQASRAKSRSPRSTRAKSRSPRSTRASQASRASRMSRSPSPFPSY